MFGTARALSIEVLLKSAEDAEIDHQPGVALRSAFKPSQRNWSKSDFKSTVDFNSLVDPKQIVASSGSQWIPVEEGSNKPFAYIEVYALSGSNHIKDLPPSEIPSLYRTCALCKLNFPKNSLETLVTRRAIFKLYENMATPESLEHLKLLQSKPQSVSRLYDQLRVCLFCAQNFQQSNEEEETQHIKISGKCTKNHVVVTAIRKSQLNRPQYTQSIQIQPITPRSGGPSPRSAKHLLLFP